METEPVQRPGWKTVIRVEYHFEQPPPGYQVANAMIEQRGNEWAVLSFDDWNRPIGWRVDARFGTLDEAFAYAERPAPDYVPHKAQEVQP